MAGGWKDVPGRQKCTCGNCQMGPQAGERGAKGKCSFRGDGSTVGRAMDGEFHFAKADIRRIQPSQCFAVSGLRGCPGGVRGREAACQLRRR